MKNMTRFISLLLFASSMAFGAGTYEIDPMHSKVGFEVDHLVISSVEGKFTKFTGKVDLQENFSKSKFETIIDAASVDTGVGQRDDHLRSADFFDVKKFSQITFKSTKIEGKQESFKMLGELTIRGVTHKVTLDTKYLGTVVDGYGNEKVAFLAKTVINRKDFGLSWNSAVEAGPVVGDKISIELKIQAARPKVKVSLK